MNTLLAEAMEIIKRLPEGGLEKAITALKEIKAECDAEKTKQLMPCPHCNGTKVVKNGRKHKKQAYLCKTCGSSFVETTKTIFENSHCGASEWKQVIADTVHGVPIKETAAKLSLHHETVFNMRHKILFAIEQDEIKNPTQLEGVCEADEVYILESFKGMKLPDDFWRKPRKHGAKATKSGLSREYICVCTGIERDNGRAVATSVNRSTAGKDDIARVFGERVGHSTILLSDGAKGYSVLAEMGKCSVLNAKTEKTNTSDNFYHINTVNGFHSFIKERNREARGFATKYLNRYNVLFSKVYRSTKAVVDDVFDLLTDMSSRSVTIQASQSTGLLEI